jgi:hypothetical protein
MHTKSGCMLVSIFERNTLGCIQSLEPKMVHTKGFYGEVSLSLVFILT